MGVTGGKRWGYLGEANLRGSSVHYLKSLGDERVGIVREEKVEFFSYKDLNLRLLLYCYKFDHVHK